MENKRTLDTLLALRDAGALLACSHDLPSALQALAEKVHEHFKPESTSLLLLDDTSQELRCETALGDRANDLKGTRMTRAGDSGSWSLLAGDAGLLEELNRDDPLSRADEAPSAGRSVFYVPIRGSDNVLGAFRLTRSVSGVAFQEQDISALHVLAAYAAVALEKQRYFERLHALTITDDCTGLYNARHLKVMIEAELYRCSRFGHEFSVVFMDLDGFKRVNDEHGHLIGSKLLGKIGNLIKSHLRLIDSAFRYGGDEFVLLLPQTSKRNALVVVRRLRATMNSGDFFAADGPHIHTSASYGVASFPMDGRNAEELLLRADQAMYQAKTRGGDEIAVVGEESLGAAVE